MKKIRLGIIGLGRMGTFHSRTATLDPNSEVVAVCALDDDYGWQGINDYKKWRGDNNFNIYHDAKKMFEKENLDAVLIVSSTQFHPEHVVWAVEHGVHIFVEKPLGTQIKDVVKLQNDVGNKLKKLLFKIGYVRRSDESFARAKEIIDSGKIGKPFLFRGYSQDPVKFIQPVITLGASLGGEFIDMSAHDINLARWYLGTEPSEVWAIGDTYAFEEFKGWNDADNATALIKFEPDQDGKQAMAFLLAGRTAAHGYNVEAEIIGTKGAIRIASVPRKDLVEVMDETGVVVECSQIFLERFKDAYQDEVRTFLKDVCEVKNETYDWSKPPLSTLEDGVRDLIACYKCKESFETKKWLKINWEKEMAL